MTKGRPRKAPLQAQLDKLQALCQVVELQQLRDPDKSTPVFSTEAEDSASDQKYTPLWMPAEMKVLKVKILNIALNL